MLYEIKINFLQGNCYLHSKMQNIYVLLISLIISIEFFTQTQAIQYFPVYKPSNSQVILEQYQDRSSQFKLFLVMEDGMKRLKKVHYNKIRNVTRVFTLNFTGDMYSLKGYDPNTFLGVIISNKQQTNYSVYVSYYYTTDDQKKDQFYLNDSNFDYKYKYSVDPKFIPQKGKLKKIQMLDTFFVLRINQKIIKNKGTLEQVITQSKQIIGMSENLKYLFLYNAVYQWNYYNFNYLFSIEISTEYQCTPYTYKQSYLESSNVVQYQFRIFFFCFKFNDNLDQPSYDWLVKGYFQSQNYPKGTLIDQLSGTTLQIPIFKVSRRLKKFMVAGRNNNQSPMILIKRININDLVFQDVSIPPTIKIQQNVIQLTQWHMYVRSKIKVNQKYKYQIYVIIITECILISTSYLNQSQNSNLISSFIFYPYHISTMTQIYGNPSFTFTLLKFLSSIQTSQLKLIHYYKNQTDYYITYEQFPTIEQMQLEQNNKFNAYQFNSFKDIFNNQIKYFKQVQQTKRIYRYRPELQRQSTIFVLQSYILNTKINITIDGVFFIIKISQGPQNCILAKDYTNTLVSIVFNQKQQKLQILQVYQYDYNILNLQTIAFSIKKLQTNCQGFTFGDNQIWRKKKDTSQSPIFQKDQLLNSNILKQSTFSKTLKYIFYYENQTQYKMYQYNDIKRQYNDILYNKKIDFYNLNKFNVSTDQTNIIILSTNQLKNQSNITYYINKPIVLGKVSTQWKVIQNIREITSISNYYILIQSLNLQIMVCLFNSGYFKKIIVYKINYSLNTAIDITNFSKILMEEYSVQQNIYIKLSNNYLYIRNRTNQYLLKLTNSDGNIGFNQIIMQNRIDLAYSQYLKWQQVIINENINKNEDASLIYYYNQQSSSSKDVLNLRTIKNDKFKYLVRIDLRGITYDSENDKIYQCVAGCEYCLHRNLCRKCKDGYYLAYGIKLCLKCSENCKTCTFSRPDICLSCFPGYILSGSICKKCHVNCFQCSLPSQNKCISCRIDRTLVSQSKVNKTCIQCPGNCSYCQQSTKCKQCETGFALEITGKCTPCPLNCSKCDPQALSSCLQCKTGFYIQKSLNSFQNITCMRCSANCKSCTSQIQCYQCTNTYCLKRIQLPPDDSQSSVSQFKIICVVKCVLPCRQCSQQNSTQCLSCAEGYIYNKTTMSCDFDLSCNSFLNCTICPYEYSLVKSTCAPCFGNLNCDSCYKYNFSICLSCKKGYYLSQNECFPCSAQCQECVIQDVCTKCKSGYVFRQDMSASPCIPCSSNCKSCIFTPANCLTCNQNMQLYGSKCKSIIRIDFNMTLDYDHKSFSSADYDGITNEMCRKTGKSREQITIKIPFCSVAPTSRRAKKSVVLNFNLPDSRSFGPTATSSTQLDKKIQHLEGF